MKNLFLLLFLSIAVISCKKKEQTETTPYSVSKGDLLMLVVSDSVEYAIEYEKVHEEALFYASPLVDSNLFAEFINGYYRYVIYPHALEMTSIFYVEPAEQVVVDFPVFNGYYPYIDSVPGYDLEKSQAYSVSLDSSQIDFVIPFYSNQWDAGGWKSTWNKVRNLRIVYEYRIKYPDSRVAFLCLKKSNGETKRYFFMTKYKP